MEVTTIAIIDFAHSGTTMLAGICEILGVPMSGENRQVQKIEDHDIIYALRNGNEERFAELVAQRNAEHESWGFKFPGAWKFAPELESHLRDPVYLAIYKDPVSVSRRRFGHSRDRWLRKIRNTGRQMRGSIDGIYASRLPVHMLSYHKAIIKPGVFVQEVASLIDWGGDCDQLSRATEYIQPNMGGPLASYPKVESWI